MNIDLSRFTQGLLADWGTLSLEELIATRGVELINFFIGFAAFIAVVMLVVGGYLFITSAGDPEKTEKAQKTITAAIIGLIIVFIARAIVFFVVDIGDLGNGGGGGGGGSPAGQPCNALYCIQYQGSWFVCSGGYWTHTTDPSKCPI
jgi:amino acid transporter